jgi:hypothetical protein
MTCHFTHHGRLPFLPTPLSSHLCRLVSLPLCVPPVLCAAYRRAFYEDQCSDVLYDVSIMCLMSLPLVSSSHSYEPTVVLWWRLWW